MTSRTVLPLILSALLIGCNDKSRGNAFYTVPTTHVGNLRVFIALSFTFPEQQAIQSAIQARHSAFVQNIVPIVQAQYPGTNTNATRDVYVYDRPHLDAPWALTVPGWTDMDRNYRINVVAGHCNIVPNMVDQLTHSYFFPNDIHHQGSLVFNVPVWASVAIVESNVTSTLRVQRLCPH